MNASWLGSRIVAVLSAAYSLCSEINLSYGHCGSALQRCTSGRRARYNQMVLWYLSERPYAALVGDDDSSNRFYLHAPFPLMRNFRRQLRIPGEVDNASAIS